MSRPTTPFARKSPFDLRTQPGPYDHFNGSPESPPPPRENPPSFTSESDSSTDALFALSSPTLLSTKSFETVVKANTMAKLANLSALEPFSGSTKQDAKRWMIRFKREQDVVEVSPSMRLRDLNALLTDVAADWADEDPKAVERIEKAIKKTNKATKED